MHYGLRWIIFISLCMGIACSVGWNLPVAAQTATTATPKADDPVPNSEVTTELPPPDIPASNQFGYTFLFDSTLTADLALLPREAAVYIIDVDPISAAQAAKIAGRLGIQGDLEDGGDGTYEASGDGEVFISPELIQYFSLAEVGDGELPSDEAAVDLARDWLRERVLLPKNADEGRVVERSAETSRVIVQFLPSEPPDILSAYPAVVVTVGPGNVVLEVSSRWADVDRADLYQLRSPEDAWDDVQSGQGYTEVDVPLDVAAPGADLSGKATYDSVGISYTTAGPPGGTQYLQPIYVFSGKVELDGSDETHRIRTFVPAIANSGAPVG